MDRYDSLPFGLNLVVATSHPLASAIVGMVLYGSWARGEATEASDIDILVVMESTFPIRRELYTVIRCGGVGMQAVGQWRGCKAPWPWQRRPRR